MEQPLREQRPYDLILFGATGFTGRLVAAYLAESRPRELRWALGGRSLEKLAEVRASLAALDATLRELPLLQADSNDADSLAVLAKSSRTICSTVGPYAFYGQKLVAACAEHGTDYCDITGEVPFIREIIDRYHQRAEATGARIVPCCGFDSLPSDLGVYLLHDYFAAQGKQLAVAKLYVEKVRGGVSSGTLASLLNILDEAQRDRGVRKLFLDPYALNPDRDHDRGRDGLDQLGVAWDADARCWTGPFLMAPINTRVVRRSNALRGFAYGRDFRYSEVMAFRAGVAGLLRATGFTAAMATAMTACSIPALRRLLQRRLLAKGEGPSREQRERGSFRIRIRGKSTADAPPAKAGSTSQICSHATVLIEGNRDPGYGETARMLGESALCLAQDELPLRGGVLTPASCMGSALVKRLRETGTLWEVRAASAGARRETR